jgi:DNA polymerase III epsilon subunit-like protein
MTEADFAPAHKLSSHKLRIETGRHKRPWETREDRICTRCQILSEERAPIDDEHHLLFDCQATAGVRQRHVGLQATNLRDLMQHPDIGRVS